LDDTLDSLASSCSLSRLHLPLSLPSLLWDEDEDEDEAGTVDVGDDSLLMIGLTLFFLVGLPSTT